MLGPALCASGMGVPVPRTTTLVFSSISRWVGISRDSILALGKDKANSREAVMFVLQLINSEAKAVRIRIAFMFIMNIVSVNN